MKPTPTENKLRLRTGGFATLVEALEYAAQGDTGFNFYSGNGELQDVSTYTLLKNKAQAIAGRLLALGLERGARVALIAGHIRCITSRAIRIGSVGSERSGIYSIYLRQYALSEGRNDYA